MIDNESNIGKICVFSDIHGNGPAFDAAYQRLLAENADLNIHLGDLCGYYFDQMDIYTKLCTMPRMISVCGNHDDIFLKVRHGAMVPSRDYRNQYGSSIDRLVSTADDAFAAWVGKWPLEQRLDRIGIYACHGSPEAPLTGYVYPDAPLEPLQRLPFDFLLMGHTHYPMIRRCGTQTIVNPGSIGQPRHGGKPSYATIDLRACSVELHSFTYDKDDLVTRIEAMGDSTPYLTKVLRRSK